MSDERLDKFDMAFESGVEESPNLWRVTYCREVLGKRLRCTNYFGSQHECQEFIARHQDDVIMVREYCLQCEGEA
jgi:hypothetical protein